jgi:hypothetical protein
MKTCKQCGKEVPEDYWLPCCPAPSDCYHRHIRGLPPRISLESVRPTVTVNPEPPRERQQPVAVEESKPTPRKPRKVGKYPKRISRDDAIGLGVRITKWLLDHRATRAERAIPMPKIAKALSF